MKRYYSIKPNPLRKLILITSKTIVAYKILVSKKDKRYFILLSLMNFTSTPLYASGVRDDIPYQIYRDFAENRGPFTPGATNIAIHKKDGSLFTVFDQAPMPDWSFTNESAVTSLIYPQYISTAAHTHGKNATNSRYGGNGGNPDYHRYNYISVRINNDKSYDYSFHRLNKLVTDAVPIPYIQEARANIPLMDASRYPIFARKGNGTQKIEDSSGNIMDVAPPRVFVTGGYTGSPSQLNTDGIKWPDITIVYDTKIFDTNTLRTNGLAGDSGSPLIAWDALLQKWFIVGQFYGGSRAKIRWSIPNHELIQNNINSDNLNPFITTGSADIRWTYNSESASGTLTQQSQTLDMMGASGTEIEKLNNGKNITFTGDDGTIILHNNINQGAGSITFKGNYIVKPENDESWVGAGLDIDSDRTVTWQIKGIKDDSLHKIGPGKLVINAAGINEGDLSVGDGTIILNQQKDSNGQKQAFNSIDIVSGRSIVTLNDDKQVNPNNIYFGTRGGRLDLNGNSLTFERIHNVDNGAQLVNYNNDKDAKIIITGQSLASNQTFQGILGENDDNKRTNGSMSLQFSPKNSQSMLLLAGGANLNGDLNVQNGGALQLSGRPIQHARADDAAGSQLNDGEDWVRSVFNVKSVTVDHASTLNISEFTTLDAFTMGTPVEIYLKGDASAVLGYYYDNKLNAIHSSRCYLDDNNGNTLCTDADNSTVTSQESIAIVNANINLSNNKNSLQLGHTNFTGAIKDEGNSTVKTNKNTTWNVTENSKLSNAFFLVHKLILMAIYLLQHGLPRVLKSIT